METSNCKDVKVFDWLNAKSVLWLIIYAMLWLAIGLFSTYQVQKEIVKALGENTSKIIAESMGINYNKLDFMEGFQPEVLVVLDARFAENNLWVNHCWKIIIYNLDGKILYASNRTLMNIPQTKDLKLFKARTIPSKQESNLMSFTVPIRAGVPETFVGAVEVYTDFSVWVYRFAKMREIIWLFIAVSAILVLFSLRVLIKRASVTIGSKNEVLTDLHKRLEESDAFLSANNSGTNSAFLTALDAKDSYTAKHSSNVAAYVQKIGAELNLSQVELQTLETAAILHDIGKIGVPGHILNKQGTLTDKEFALVKKHAEIGAQIIHFIYYLEEAAEVILYHHERYDGTGYPKKLAGKDIPLTARILAVADVYDALTTDRPYRGAMSREKAVGVLLDGRCSQFDPVVVNAFISVLEREIAIWGDCFFRIY